VNAPPFRLLRRFCPIPLLAASLMAAGCVTPTATGPTPERLTGEHDPLALPATSAIGTVIFVDPIDGFAIIQVRSASTRITPILVTRNETLVETARLDPTRFQRGRTLGTQILAGLPNVGDEVYASP
jgi:hypothetical protein